MTEIMSLFGTVVPAIRVLVTYVFKYTLWNFVYVKYGPIHYKPKMYNKHEVKKLTSEP